MKSFHFPRIVLAFHALFLSLQSPSLIIAASDSGDIRLNVGCSRTNATLSWSLPDSAFVLESATSPDSTDWQNVSDMLTINEGSCKVTVNLDEGQRYFRLRRRDSTEAGDPDPTLVNGYIAAVLRSECASAPPPPPVGEIATGSNYVIMTVADGDPLDYQAAQQIVTDAVFETLMPLYCGLPDGHCVTNRVQWNLLTYDAGGNARISGSPISGPAFHYCAVTTGFVTAVIRGNAAVLPPPPPVGQVAVGTDAVILTIAEGDPLDLEAARQLATDEVFGSLMRHYCALPRGTESGSVSGRAQWQVATFDPSADLRLSGCAASGCEFHECEVSNGYITAVLRSECASAPPPPPVGEIATGSNYVIMTVADGDPLDYQAAQQIVTDAVFETLMPLYCGLPDGHCVTNRVQWNLLTYDAGGNPKISGSPTSGPAFHYCAVTTGFVTAVIRGHAAVLPPPPPVGQVAVGTDAVMLTIAEGDPLDLEAAQRLATDAVFESLMRHYCAAGSSTNISGRAKWQVATFDPGGNPQLSGCAASGCEPHVCGVAKGYITAVLRSECASAPPPPPVGETVVGTNYVIMTVADCDPLDYQGAQQIVTDAIFERLMPLYCALPDEKCVSNRVQWNLMTYDAGGNPKISGSPTSGPGYHYCQ